MAEVMVELKPPAARIDEIELVPDVEVLSESNRCACASSDDNPY